MIWVFIEYGIQLWLVIFITNIAVFYGFSFFSRAANNKLPNIELTITPPESPSSAEPSPTESLPTPTFTPTPTAAGPVINLSFSMPGVSSLGGNIKPQHPVRDVTVFLYDPDSNTSDITVRPLYTIKTNATYDNDPSSPTYTSFVNSYIDLGGDVKEGVYQITFKSRQTLMAVIKDPNAKSVGGKKFQVNKSSNIVLPSQFLISGDIYPVPDSDNLMDINDYNMLVNCFGEKAYTHACISGSTSDIDDNGVIDGIDYNLMLLSFIKLKERGFNVPEINPPPVVIKPIFSNVLTPTPTKLEPTKIKSKSTGAGGIILFIIFLLFGGVGAFIAFKKHLLDGLLNKLFHKSLRDQSQSPIPVNDENYSQSDTPVTVYPPQNPSQGSIPPVAPSAPTQAPAVASNGAVEESGFLKKVKVDTQKSGTWITLADDSGIKRGFYQGTNVTDGFVKIKGTIKNDDENKPFILITEIIPED